MRETPKNPVETTMRRPAGLTLIELVVVLAILVAIASLAIGVFTNLNVGAAGQAMSPQQAVTEATMLEARNAIMGTPTAPGYFQDMGQIDGRLPTEMVDLFVASDDLPVELRTFDPETAQGWRGPYVQSATGTFDDPDGALTAYGQQGDPTLIDGWGRPIVIQLPDVASGETEEEWRHLRLVSLGEDGLLQTPANVLMPQGPATAGGSNPSNQRGDDLVLFLRVTDETP